MSIVHETGSFKFFEVSQSKFMKRGVCSPIVYPRNGASSSAKGAGGSRQRTVQQTRAKGRQYPTHSTPAHCFCTGRSWPTACRCGSWCMSAAARRRTGTAGCRCAGLHRVSCNIESIVDTNVHIRSDILASITRLDCKQAFFKTHSSGIPEPTLCDFSASLDCAALAEKLC